MGRPSVNKLISAFIESLAVEKGYSANTCRSYRNDLEGFVEYLVQNPPAGTRRSQSGDPGKIDGLRTATDF